MNKCLLCGQSITQRLTIHDILMPGRLKQLVVCKVCRDMFVPYASQNTCRACGREATDKLCPDCLMWEEKYGWYLEHHPLFHYNQAMKEFMQQYKFQGNYQLRHVFADTMRTAIEKYDFDLLIPIPVTKQTLHTRGFNQVTGLIESVPYQELILHQKERKDAQSCKDRHARLNTEQPFTLKEGSQLRGKNILIVDDIYTTGRTLYHAAVLCRDAGCKRLQSLSLAR